MNTVALLLLSATAVLAASADSVLKLGSTLTPGSASLTPGSASLTPGSASEAQQTLADTVAAQKRMEEKVDKLAALVQTNQQAAINAMNEKFASLVATPAAAHEDQTSSPPQAMRVGRKTKLYEFGDGAYARSRSLRAAVIGNSSCFAFETAACRVSDTSTSAASAFEQCFGAATPSTAVRVAMSELSAGDRVLGELNGAPALTRVILNQHKAAHEVAPLLALTHAAGVLRLTADHVLLVDGRFTAAREATVGATLFSPSLGQLTVLEVRTEVGRIINPTTVSGKVLAADADGAPVVAATANELFADALLEGHAIALAPFPSLLSLVAPQHVQEFYDKVVEPALPVTSIAALKLGLPIPVAATLFALGDLAVTAAFVFWCLLDATVLLTLGAVAFAAKGLRKA